MFKIAVANEKGGVAKTTSTVSLAAGLAESGKKVLLLDLDAQANTTLSVGLDPTVCKNTIFDTLIRSMDVAEIILPTNIPNISIIPANHDVGLIEQNLPRLSDYECRLRNALATVNGQFDFAIFDCPPFLGSVTINAITASNLLMISHPGRVFLNICFE